MTESTLNACRVLTIRHLNNEGPGNRPFACMVERNAFQMWRPGFATHADDWFETRL